MKMFVKLPLFLLVVVIVMNDSVQEREGFSDMFFFKYLLANNLLALC
jgi:hypothetical protein